MIRSIENNVYHGTDTIIDQPFPATSVKSRTEAQREASRINGSKSRGPTTPAGKSRSKRNALKHGLRVEKLGPPSDVRELNREYRKIHAELMNEFEPVTFTERRAVEDLAWNLQRLDQAKQMIDAASTPPEFAEEALKEQYRLYRRARHDERLASNLLAALRSGETPDLKPAGADRLAEQVVALTNQVEQDLAEAAEELDELLAMEAEGALSDDDRACLAELRELQEHHRLIHPCRRVLREDARLAALFRGELSIGKTLRMSLTGLVVDLHRQAANRVASSRDAVRRLEQAAERHLMQLALKPDRLVNLDLYHARIARLIRMQIESLRQTRG